MTGDSPPLRVLHLGSPTGLYGAERWILALVRYLPADIHSVVGTIRDVPGREPDICTQAASLGYRTVTIDAPGRLSRTAVAQLRNFIRAEGIRVLHTHGYKTDIIGALAVRGTGCRIVSTPHGWSAAAGLKLRLYELLNRAAFWLHDAVVPLSADIHRGLSRLPGLQGRLHLIRNGVDLGEVDVAVARREAWPASAFVFGYIGQLIPRKGLAVLLQAFSTLSDTPARLCLVGEGPQRAELEQLARELGVTDRVTFTGYRPDRLDLLKGFDSFVLPSELEGIPRCVLEAMAARVPVIVSDIPGSTDVVSDGMTGSTFAVGSAGELAVQMRQAIANRERSTRLAVAAEQLVRSEYSSQAMAGSYAQLYRLLIDGNAG